MVVRRLARQYIGRRADKWRAVAGILADGLPERVLPRRVRDQPLDFAADGSQWRSGGRVGVVWFHHGAAAGVHGPGAIADPGRESIRAPRPGYFGGQVQDHGSGRAAYVDSVW